MSLRISLGLFTKILWMFKEFKQFFMLNSRCVKNIILVLISVSDHFD